MAVKISVQELVASGAHFGHQTKRWNPKMAEYIYGDKDGIHIFDLIKSKKLLEEALDVLAKSAKEEKKVLFVGTKKQVKDKIKDVASQTNSFYVNERWLGGTLTNFEQIKKSIKKLNDLKKGREEGEFKSRTKKERLLIDREIERLERFFGGLNGMDKLPDMIVVIDVKREKTAIKEAATKGVEIIAVVDTNCDPDLVDYVIPLNDDATKALEYLLELMKEAMLGKSSKSKSKNKPKKES